MTGPLTFLEELQSEFPDLAEDVTELANLYQRKLWHNLTLKLEACFHSSAWNRGDIPVRLFQSFVMDFGHKMNFLKLAQFAVHACKFQPDPPAATALLSSVIARLEELKQSRTAEAVLFLRMHLAQYKLETGDAPGCKAIAFDVAERLAAMSDVDPSVSAACYYVTSLYHKAQAAYADYYRSALTYLSYVSSDSLQPDFKLRLAVDISLAALLGEAVYSFGSLLSHPIVSALDGTPAAWLHDMLRAFHAGDMAAYDGLCATHAAALNAQPALVANERRLREKITLCALLDLVGSTPPEQRRIPLDVIGARARLERDGVEFLIMKALSLGLIEGVIDGVAGVVDVRGCVPRVLAREEVGGVRTRLEGWVGRVAAVEAALAGAEAGGAVNGLLAAAGMTGGGAEVAAA